jgi:hypothetical protein
VSTEFIGIDQKLPSKEEEPFMFETTILGGEHDNYIIYTSTWEEAEEAHCQAIMLVFEI